MSHSHQAEDEVGDVAEIRGRPPLPNGAVDLTTYKRSLFADRLHAVAAFHLVRWFGLLGGPEFAHPSYCILIW